MSSISHTHQVFRNVLINLLTKILSLDNTVIHQICQTKIANVRTAVN